MRLPLIGHAVRWEVARKFCDDSMDLGFLRPTALGTTGERKHYTLMVPWNVVPEGGHAYQVCSLIFLAPQQENRARCTLAESARAE